MTPKDLKNSILQLAIQGKLVEQRAEEGTAEELYQEIQKEKAALIKAGKIKKQKPLPVIKEEEKPFDIPETWKWVRWGSLSESIQYGYNAPAKEFGRIRMVRISDIKDNNVLWNTVPFCDIKEEDIDGYRLKENDILFARTGGTVGKSFLVKSVPFESIYAGYLIRTRYSDKLCPEYMKFFMESQLYWAQLHNGTIATAQPNCNGQTLSKMMLPLPPLAEQQRIVAKIGELLPLIERYEAAYNRLEKLNKRFPDDLKKSILQLAIQGKLVEQRAEEGTAEELYRQIQKEKAAPAQIKAGKIKKQKPLPEIREEETPFDIPETWKWVRLGEVGTFLRGSGIKRSEVMNDGYPCVRYGQLYTTYRTRFSVVASHIDKDLFAKCKKARQNDILMALTGENNFDIALAVKYEGNREIAIGGDMTKFTPCFVDSMFLVYLINSPYCISIKSKLATGNIIVHISNDSLSTIIIPLPPLAEQHRIVAKIEELLPLCEQLK